MGQLRDKIREMVRNEFAARLLAEANKSKDVYRHSNYDVGWDTLPAGTAGSEEASKNDFVRWFMSKYANKNTTLRLEDEELAEVMALLQPLVNKPDEFIEAVNKNRGLVFGNSNFQSDPDPVSKLLRIYVNAKELQPKLAGTTFDDKIVEDEPEQEKVYDVDPTLVVKRTISDLLKFDPSETTTDQSVGNKLESAIRKLAKVFTESDEEDIAEQVKIINKTVRFGLKNYVGTFVEHAIDAFRGLTQPVSDADAETALRKGLVEFANDLKIDPSLVGPSTPDYEVFKVILLLNDDEVKDLLIEAANSPEAYEDNYDRIADVTMEVLADEMNRQTNFNSLGIYIQNLPAIKGVREFFGTEAKRGRPTKETVAARQVQQSGSEESEPSSKPKASVGSEEETATGEYKALYRKAIDAYLKSKGLTSLGRGRPSKEMMEFIKDYLAKQGL